MMRAVALFLSIVLIGRACSDDHARGQDEVQGVATPSKEDQRTTPTLGLPPKAQRKGELHVGQARLVGRHEPVTGKIHASASAVRVAKTIHLNQTGVGGCENVRCDRHEICVHQRKTLKPVCVRRKSFRASKRHGHGHNSQVIRASAKLIRNHNASEVDLHHKVEKLKLHAQEFQEQHDQKFKLSATTDKMMKLRSKKFISDNSLENNTSDKSNKDCRQKELDGVGQHLLDQFKMNQDEDLDRQKTANKRRKEKRNSTKKELHEDDECICQAPVSWKFQHMDADTDGHLSQKELLNLTAKGACISRFISSCDHDNDAALSEKEWCCCFADILPPCLASLKSVPSILVRGQPMVITGSFVPQCDDDGFYSKVQCHSSTGECWCVDRNGQRLSSTAATTGSPDCGMQ